MTDTPDYSLTPEEAQMIEQGIAAEYLLANPLFDGVINHLTSTYMQDIMNSEPGEEEKRNHSYFCIRGLQDILATLKTLQVTKDQYVAETNQPDEE